MNHGKGFIDSIDLLRSEGSQITDSNPDRLLGTHLHPAVLATFSAEIHRRSIQMINNTPFLYKINRFHMLVNILLISFESDRCK